VSPQSAGDANVVAARCELVAKPRGKLQATVVDMQGAPVAGARVILGGPSARELVTDAMGRADTEGLAPGSYEARVEADAYLVKLTRVAVTAGLVATPRIELQAKPKVTQVELTQSEVRIRQQVLFGTGSADILDKSSELIDEIADVLLRNPQVRNIEVQGHTDSSGSPEINLQLSQQRAEAVVRALIARGVESTRLSAKGYGDTRPLAPNITAANRARNRRVQFAAPGHAPAGENESGGGAGFHRDEGRAMRGEGRHQRVALHGARVEGAHGRVRVECLHEHRGRIERRHED